ADHDEIRRTAVGHEFLAARDPPACELGLPLVRLPALAGLAERDRREHVAGGELGQPLRALRRTAGPCDRESRERVTEERHRQRALTDHLGGEREIEHLECAAAVLVWQREAADTDLDESLPQRRVVSLPCLE